MKDLVIGSVAWKNNFLYKNPINLELLNSGPSRGSTDLTNHDANLVVLPSLLIMMRIRQWVSEL